MHLKQRHPVSPPPKLSNLYNKGWEAHLDDSKSCRRAALLVAMGPPTPTSYPQASMSTHSARAAIKCELTGPAKYRAARAARWGSNPPKSDELGEVGVGDGRQHHLRAPQGEIGPCVAHLGAHARPRRFLRGPSSSATRTPAIPNQSGSTRAVWIPTFRAELRGPHPGARPGGARGLAF